MHHLTLADKSLLIGDDAADLLMAYAAVVAQQNGGDHITIEAFGIDGVQTSAQILLNSGTTMVAESSTSLLPEPDNTKLELYIRDRLAFFGLAEGNDGPTDVGRIV